MLEGSGTWDQLFNVTQAKLSNQAVERKRIAITQLVPNPEQPRRYFDDAALNDLTNSVRVHGVLQPILVRPVPGEKLRYEIVAGERRFRAAKEAGLTDIPVVVRELDDRDALELGLVENLLREDVTVMEEARALQKLLDTFGYSYAQLGERLGKNKAYVDHRVRLLKMPAEVQDALERDALAQATAQRIGDARTKKVFTPRHAEVVVQLESAQSRQAVIDAVFADQLSVAQTRAYLHNLKTGPKTESRAVRAAKQTRQEDSVLATDCESFRLFQSAVDQQGRVSRQALIAALRQDLDRLA